VKLEVCDAVLVLVLEARSWSRLYVFSWSVLSCFMVPQLFGPVLVWGYVRLQQGWVHDWLSVSAANDVKGSSLAVTLECFLG
jgi:uncharacterized Tic20 family protein